jgi:hypothetical protein
MGEAFIKKYPKYCAKCSKYYPAAWKECTVCKVPLVWAGHGYALHLAKRINYWLIILCLAGAAFWGVNKAWTRINQGEVAAYVRANALDVIELENGRKIIGKIVGETPRSYFIKNVKGREEKIGRDSVKIKRRASNEELEIARVLLAKNTGRSQAKRTTGWEKFCFMIGSVADRIEAEARYHKEVASARKAKSNLERRLAEEKAKGQAGEEGLPIEQKLLRWIQSGVTPAKKEE